MPEVKCKAKVKIVAIAKDEGAYFPEWVHHHLYLGFDAIDIYINRTSDNSSEILDKISLQYPQVRYFSADWIDTCHPQASRYLQYIIYAKAFSQNKESEEFDYILFIDVDEFWFPVNPSLKVQDIIAKLSEPECIVFQWVNEDGSEPPFSALAQEFSGKLHSNVKSMIHRDAPISVIQLHYPELLGEACGIFVDKDQFEPINKNDFKQLMKPNLSKIRDVMIVHRCHRSELEYISLLHRGRPSDEIPIKLNRGGYNVRIAKEVNLSWPVNDFKPFEKSRILFFKNLELGELLSSARKFVIQRADKCILSIPDVLQLYPKEVNTVFQNISNDIIVNLLTNHKVLKPKLIDTNFRQSQFDKSYIRLIRAWFDGDVDYLRDFAIDIENSQLRISYFLMRKASKLRPNGPLIRKKIADYERRFSK